MLLEGACRCEAVRSCYVPMSHATAASLSLLALSSSAIALHRRAVEARCIFRSIETQFARSLRRQGGGSPLANKGDFSTNLPCDPSVLRTSKITNYGENAVSVPALPPKTAYFSVKSTSYFIFLPKYLHSSKKSSTFAPSYQKYRIGVRCRYASVRPFFVAGSEFYF